MNTEIRPGAANDFEQVARAQEGDEEAFAWLVERYQTPVFNFCCRMLGDPAQAEDAAQETFLRACLNIRRFDVNRAFLTWLLSIAAHYCIDCLRRRKAVMVSLEEREDAVCPLQLADSRAADPQHQVEKRQSQEELQRALQSLGQTERAALILRYWHEFSEVEIAGTLGLTVPAVKSRLFRARRELAQELQGAQLSAPRAAPRSGRLPAVSSRAACS